MARLFDGSDKGRGVPLKLATGGGERRTSLVADKERATQLVFKA